MIRQGLFCIVLAVCPAVSATQQHPVGSAKCMDFTGSDAYIQLRRDGCEVVKEKQLPLDQDKYGMFVAARCGRGLALFVYGCEKSELVLLGRSGVLPGEELRLFDTLELGKRIGILFKVVEDSPDEAVFNESVFLINPSGIYQVLKSRWELRHSEAEAGRQPVEVVDLGGLPLGLAFEPAEQVGDWPVAVLRSRPKVLELNSHSGNRTEVVIGSYTEVFSKGDMGFHPVFRGFEDYLTPVGELRVQGSGSVSDLMRVSWSSPVAIRAVMLQFCKGTQQAERFSLHFPKEPEIQIDRANPDVPDERLLGFGDFKSPDGTMSTLIFFRKPISVSKLSFQATRIDMETSHICIANITPLTCLLDKSSNEKRPHRGP